MNYEDRITKEYVEGLLAAMPKMAAGAYTGNGATVNVELGFAPRFIVLLGIGTNYGSDILCAIGTSGRMAAVLRYDTNTTYRKCTFGDAGFSITDSSAQGLNVNGVTYYYAAFG